MQHSDRRTKEQYTLLVAEQRNSGLTQKAWCEQESISLRTFYSWVKKTKALSKSDTNHKLPVGRTVKATKTPHLQKWVEVVSTPTPLSTDHFPIEISCGRFRVMFDSECAPDKVSDILKMVAKL